MSNEPSSTYTQLDTPLVVEIAKGTYTISEYGMDNVALIVGGERALLIDTGTGTVEWDPIVRSLTDKPYDVYLTHAHVDHAGGMRQFDKVFMHRDEVAAALALTVAERRNYVSLMQAQSGTLWAIDEDSVIAWSNTPQIVEVAEGDIIDLGGRTVEIFETPGHTAGSISLLDRQTAIMFTGDACNTNTLLTPLGDSWYAQHQRTTVSTELATARRLRDLRDAGVFDRNYNGHVGYAQWIGSLCAVYDACIDDCIACCEGILDGSIVGEEQPGLDGTPNLVARYGDMQIQYLPWQVA